MRVLTINKESTFCKIRFSPCFASFSPRFASDSSDERSMKQSMSKAKNDLLQIYVK